FVRRGAEGELRAFHDVCPHRAGPVVGPPEGDVVARVSSVRKLQCGYHGWVFADDGTVERTPDFGAEQCERSLVPLRVGVWRDLVFVSMAAHGADLDDALGRLPELAAPIPLEGYRFHSRRAHRLRCDWKTYVENYLEGYHIPYVHPRLHREIDVRRYEVTTGDRVVTNHAPPRDPDADGVYDGLFAWLWPNAAVNVYGVGMSIERMVPVAPGEMRIEYLFCFSADATGAQIDDTLAMSTEVTDEDLRITEAVQRNLDAGVYDTGILSPRHEAGVAYFQSLVVDAMGE
ncbi:MAG: SRPBCC family protein, partial [Actinomycetota bacterium]